MRFLNLIHLFSPAGAAEDAHGAGPRGDHRQAEAAPGSAAHSFTVYVLTIIIFLLFILLILFFLIFILYYYYFFFR